MSFFRCVTPALAVALLAGALLFPAAALAQEAPPDPPTDQPPGAQTEPQTQPQTEPSQEPEAQTPPPPETSSTEPARPPSGQAALRKSFWIPAMDIVAFELLLNLANRQLDGSAYDVTWESIKDNANGPWVVDNDPFAINQLWHPYQGAIYQGFARSAGLNFWQAAAYTFAGSLLWEIAGETTPPSRNDQIASGIGGNFLGEPLFRMANMVLKNSAGKPGFWRELGAFGISPSTGFNRFAYGSRFDAIFDDKEPVYYSRLQLGASWVTQSDPGTSTGVENEEGLMDFSMDYGLPGKPAYAYDRPFDYFSFQLTVSSANGIDNVLTRGILAGRDYRGGDTVRGLWGLYGTYDYIAPQTFRVSNTGLAVGTTAQWSMTRDTALQGTALLGAGYAAVGTINGVDETDYHYGVAPLALTALRFNFGERSSIDVTARDYFVSGVAAASTGGHDNIVRADASFTLRLHRKQALSIRYLYNRRDASYPDLGDRTQTQATLGIFYALLGHDHFGTVDWGL